MTDEPTEPHWLEVNRGLWDELARTHARTEFYDLAGVAAGRDDLRPWEEAELGPLDGLDLIHLQCHIGTDTIALARRGARVVGLDFSVASLTVARQLADDCDVQAEWVHAEVYEAAAALDGRRFDLVYTGMGALGWLPDLWPWAETVHELLRPGGTLYVTELHPLWHALYDDGRTLATDALGTEMEHYDVDGSYADREAQFDHTTQYTRLHPISDLLSAVLDAGLQIELFHEFDASPAPTPWLEQGADRLFRFPAGAPRFPLSYSLRARRPG